MDQGCIMLNCFWTLWDWLDPPVLTSSASMDSIRMSPSPVQNQGRAVQPVMQQHSQTNQQGMDMQYQQTNQYPQQPQNMHQQQMKIHNNVISHPPTKLPMQQLGPRSPLLENHQELYGTKQQSELSRQYAIREQMQMAAQRMEHHQQQSIPHSNSSYSIPSPSQDPILNAVVPPGFNVSVHQAYLRRNQNQFDPQQIYQNHQNVYSPTSPKLYQPYSGRMQQSNYAPQGHSHTQILRQQYNELQQMKLQQQIQYQTQAQIQQQQTFAQRQILHQHLHSRQVSQQNLNQYGLAPNSMHNDSQMTDSQYLRKNEEMSPTDDYAYHPSPMNNKPVQKQAVSSPSMNYSMNNSSRNECEVSSPSSKSPSGSESRRSSSGTTQALRSPIAQRPLTAPVTMAGWLYKQGSDGLKVWRKRWFVLSEYCLFYYKGQEEDKLLGSVLLPSYRVSACTPDDKVLRKFAFKCEHTNMRTYVLAAPDRDQMNQWVNVLTMAALMQEGSANDKLSQMSNLQIKNDKNKTNNASGDQDEIIQEVPSGRQPTYENAPPKPRRSNEGYNSPSPERAIERYDPTYDTSRDAKNHSNNHSNQKPSGADTIYESKSGTAVTSNYATQRQLSKSPEPVYNAHNLSLPLKNTATTRLENNKPSYAHQDNPSNRMTEVTENRLSHNKPYSDNRNNYQQDQSVNQSPYNYPKEKQNVYNESGYQKMVQQQEYHKNEELEKFAQDLYQQNMLNHIPLERQAFERRTPDTYGRSVIVPGYYSKGRTGDYEDVYNNQTTEQNFIDKYQRPLSPMTYEDRKVSAHYDSQRYEPSNNDNVQLYSSSSHIRQKKIPHNYTAPVLPYNTVPRPHSADFLEYESKNPMNDPIIANKYASNASRQPPRPKSSMDINNYDHNGDSYYYSEASYAEKMRQSAHYLRSKASGNNVLSVKRSSIKSPDFVNQRKMSAPTFRVNDMNYDNEIRVDREPVYSLRDQNKNVSGMSNYKMNENTGLNSNWTLRNKSLSHIPLHDDAYNRSNSAMSEGSTASGFNKEQMNENGDLFIRSASARLPASEPMTSRDGERKVQQREESMKRLLEWKQRMLQSPLTRKTTPATLSLARSLNQTKSLSQTQGFNDRYTIISGQTFPKTSSKQSNHHTAYNSYSSDDEERLADNIAGDPSTTAGQRQAGRSPSPPPLPPTLTTNSNNKHDAALTCTPTLDTETNPLNITNESNFSLSNSNLKELGNSPISADYETLKNVSNNAQSESGNKDDSDELEYTDADLDEVLGLYDDNEKDKETNSSKKSVPDNSSESNKNSISIEFSNNKAQKEAYPDYEICEINQSVVPEDKNTLRNKIVTPVNTPTNPDVCENHYLPMSPRKAVVNIEPPHIAIIKSMTAFSEDQHHEDNPYVEMSQGGIESAFSKEETQAYEIVCVSSGKVEPVYMELNNVSVKNALSETDLNKQSTQPDTNETTPPEIKSSPVPKSILRKQKSDSKLSVKSSIRNDVKSPLPDILNVSQNKEFAEKSDSSDADDECSKDFSLQKAYSRFSLSDTFRPASYYLRSKNVLNDLQDSSDSEILPPPPIPMSPPPMEELEVSDSSLNHGKIEEPIKATINIPPSELPERKSTSLMDYGNTPSMYDTIFKGERVKRNRISLPDSEKPSRFYKENDSNHRSSLDLKMVPPSYKTSGNADTDSLLSYNADRGSSRMSIESDISSKFDISTVGGYQLEERPQSVITTDTMSLNESDDFVKLRHEHRLSDIELEKMLKRRPLSEESCFEIESLDQNLHHDINLDDYVNQLQSGNTFDIQNLYPFKAFDEDYTLDKKTLSYLNDRVAAIKEEVQYENVNLNERSRSRNSNGSNTISDPDTVSTFQTVYSLQKSSASSTRESPFNPKYEKGYSSRSDSRSSLPIQTNANSSPQIQETPSHTRHASFEQPTISYYSKNTSPTDNDASILKNLNRYKNQKDSINKVNIIEMNKIKSSKSAENLHHSDATPKFSSNLIFHNRDNSGEQSAPYYYSDLSSQDNLNLSGSSITSYNKNILSVSNKLNNQRRRGPVARKCDISHIHNPIHSSTMYNDAVGHDDSQNLIAAAVRCVSVEFLSAADKIADIDNKNIYESTTLKLQKTKDSANGSVSKNLYPTNNDKMRSFEHFDESSSSSHNKSWEEIIHNVVNPLQNRNISNANVENIHVSHPNIISNNLGRISDIAENTSISEANNSVSTSKKSDPNKESSDKYDGEMMWDEDALWRENLRRVSHRHARSLDHLDCLNSIENISGRCSVDLKTMLVSSKNSTDTNRHTKISRDVTYVNDNVKTQRNATLKRKQHKKKSNQSHLLPQVTDIANENDVYVQLALDTDKKTQFHDTLDDGVYEQLTVETKSEKNNSEENSTNGDGFFLLEDDSKSEIRKKFEIDREKLRQWDLMSSGLMKNESGSCVESDVNGGATEGGGSHNTSTPASVSINGVENSRSNNHSLPIKKSFTGSNPSLVRTSSRDISIPVRAVSPRVRSSSAQPWNSQNNHDYDTWNGQTPSQNHLVEDNWSTVRSPSRQSTQPIRAVSPRVRRASDVDERPSAQPPNPSNDTPISINNLSAGELLGRTHEELVLLLIQLRRKHTATANAIDQCCMQIKSVQSRINLSEMLEHKQENLQRLEQLKHHLMELEKHYEKSKPLVHLVDNMVKLGTLYNRGSGSVPSTLDRLEYNQMIRERALMEQAAEQKRWAESSESLPREHIERRVEELRAMERWVAGEAGTLRGLKQERETLSGPALQQDLSRVHAMLAINSKKLEQTVAGNARLEQELMVLRQKLQQQQQNGSTQHLNAGSSTDLGGIDARTAADATALLEDELRRVQQLVGDLQKQRQELSVAVRQLTDKSQTLGLISPTKQAQQSAIESYNAKDTSSRVRNHSVWLETDLDTNTFVEHGTSGNMSSSSLPSTKRLTPLYIDTQSNTNYNSENKDIEPSPIVSDELSQNNMFNNLTNVEKQEIKTVRIVKRESERRQRDRERSLQPGNSDWSSQQTGSILDQLVEEDALSSYQNRSTSLPRGFQTNQSQASYSSSYTNDNLSSKSYGQTENISSQYRSQTSNPPNTLSLTNVNIPFESMSTSSANSTSKYLSSPSLNNNDYLTNHKDPATNYYSKYGYTDHYSTNYTIPKESLSRSIPYLDSPVDVNRPLTNGPISPQTSKNGSINSLNKGNAELSPVFTSETARQIIIEMAGEKNGFVQNNNGSQHRRQVPKEKRRHYTAPHDVISKTLEKSADDDIFFQDKWWRARDDVDMERVLRSGINGANKHGPPPLVAPPDVVRSTLPTGPLPEHYSEHTIDRLLAAPNKILIPERYVPEQAPELSPEEQKKRKEKVESIKKMLSSTTTPSSDPNKSPDVEDKRQREHLLQLNQILAKQVMEMSKIVAVKALEKLPLENESNYDSEDLSPDVELPLYQQRDNYFT